MALRLRSLSRLGEVASLKGDEGVTYVSMLCRASHFSIRLVRKQLGHRSTQTTRVYADVLSEDAALAVENLPQ
jgi:integrase